jgi:hypothetical protein
MLVDRWVKRATAGIHLITCMQGAVLLMIVDVSLV